METKQIMLVCAAGWAPVSWSINTKLQRSAWLRRYLRYSSVRSRRLSKREKGWCPVAGTSGPLSVGGFTGKSGFKRHSGRDVILWRTGIWWRGDKVGSGRVAHEVRYSMENKDSLEVAMTLIMYGGEAKSCAAIEAIAVTKAGFLTGGSLQGESGSEGPCCKEEAHHAQAEMLSRRRRRGKDRTVLFMVHGAGSSWPVSPLLIWQGEIVDLHKNLMNRRNADE